MVIPEHIGLLDWAAQLQIDFPNDNVPILLAEDAWREWGLAVLGCPSFRKANAPPPFDFNDWREWALGLFLAVTRSSPT